MLPGLQIFDLREPSGCKILRGIVADFENGSTRAISWYHSPECSAECNDHHLVVYLENALCRGCPVCCEDIYGLLFHGNAKVRKISLLLYCRHFPDAVPPSSLQHDPSHLIRTIYLEHGWGSGVSSLAKHARDENLDVRKAAMCQLMRFSSDEKHKVKVLRSVCRGMRDRELSIRVFASKAIGEFRNLSDEIIQRLLSKQGASADYQELCGALVYGIEDEYAEVRRNTVASVYSLVTPGTASRTFDFIVDSLNDEDDVLRELCTFYLKMISVRYVLAIDKEIVRQICESLRERNVKVRANILDLLANLRYEDVEVFDILTAHMGVNVGFREVLRCIGRIASKNRRLFLANMGRFYKHTSVAQIEPSLEDDFYIAKLMVLRELKRADPGIEVSRVIEDHFLFLEIMECSRPDGCGDGYIFFKDILCQFLEEKNRDGESERQYRKLFRRMRREDDPRYWFIYYLYEGMVELRCKKKDDMLQRAPFLFANTGFDASVACNPRAMVEYIQSLDFGSIRFLRYDVDVPPRVSVCRRMPIRFSASLLLEEDIQDVHLKVWSGDKPPIHFKARKTVDVCILDDGTSICCSVVKLLGCRDVQLSRTKVILIERKKPKKDLIPGIDSY
uniref:Uncharacterized protein n=1 Tax=Encephalitozoon cuniculi TaxID=6035 RepID=M1K601_ENCCN|nr:hypothetical protein [Encephalitozoon cuniculi]